MTTGVRLASFYAAFLAVYGVQLPFWPVWLESKGLGPTDIGLIVATTVGARLVGNPLAAHFADLRRDGTVLPL